MIALLAAFSFFAPAQAAEAPRVSEIKREAQITYVDRSGAVLGVRGGRYAPPLDISRLPAYVPAAFVAIEDRRFYAHSGFDALGIARAIVTDIGEGRAAEGASTITQQLARNLYLTNDRTAQRKVQELLLAVQLERSYTKPQILGLYLSRVYFGSGAYGLEAAAQRYFNKPAARLTVAEAAMLAGVLKSPTNYDPVDQYPRAVERSHLVLDAMVETKALSKAVRDRVVTQSPKVWPTAPTAPAQYFIDWLDGQARPLIGQVKQDVVVETTLDLPLEIAAGDSTRTTLARHRKQLTEQAAVVSLDGHGAVRAMVGGGDYAKAPFNRAVGAHRQAGSAWKPFVYLAALEAGRTPETLVVDEPVTIKGWSPSNYTEAYLGPITLETALAQSINTVAARLADEVGRDNVAAAAHRIGITSPINTEPAMALGTTLVTPLEMAQAYSAFANGGDRWAAYGIERIRTNGGQLIYQRKAVAPAPVIANPPLSDLNRMLRGVIIRGTATKAAIPGFDLAGKTGTTSDYKDAWFAGYTGGLTTVVWMGRDDAKPMRKVTGGGPPTELWRGYMKVALKRLPVQPIPGGVPAPVVTPPVVLPDAAAPLPQPAPVEPPA